MWLRSFFETVSRPAERDANECKLLQIGTLPFFIDRSDGSFPYRGANVTIGVFLSLCPMACVYTSKNTVEPLPQQ
jgi:hypothetical protein